MDEPKARIFISYSRKDMAFANRLEAALKSRGFEPMIDREEIFAFEDWWKRIEVLIAHADTVVFVLSPDAVTSEVALKEVAHAASLNKRFAPIVCRLVEASAVPEKLRRLNFIFFDDPSRFEENADYLSDALLADIGWIREKTELEIAANHWSAASKANGLLLRSPGLEGAERWIISSPHNAPAPTEETLSFIHESRRDATRRRHRAQLLLGCFAAVMVSVSAAWSNQNWLKDQLYAMSNVTALNAGQERALKPRDSFNECADCPEMIVVPAQSFLMGSPEGQGEDDEHPQHNVTFAKPFAVSKFELTFDEWDACVAHSRCFRQTSDSNWGRSRRPVINVSWDDAQIYVAWLSRLTGKQYRLLSEAEFEYAARAGVQAAYPWGDEIGKSKANCNGCGSQWGGDQTAPVGSFAPNRFGLYDMAGNVVEWVEDCYHDTYDGAPMDGSAWITGGHCDDRVIRGGSWFSGPVFLRSGNRNWATTGRRYDSLGFRVGRTLIAP